MATQLCVLCGENAATTRDHIPPRGIYPMPRPDDLYTVPACRRCNAGDSADDEEFKVFLSIDTGDFRGDIAPIIDSLARTVRHNRRIANQIFSTQRRGFANRGRGILEPVRVIEFKPESYIKVIQRIVRGLYWREMSKVLGLTSKIQVISARNMKRSDSVIVQDLLYDLPIRKLNKDTFVYKCQIDSDGHSFWAMQFFGKHIAFAVVDLATPEAM